MVVMEAEKNMKTNECCERVAALWLVCLSPDQVVQVWALALAFKEGTLILSEVIILIFFQGLCSLYLLENVHHTWKHCVVSFTRQG